MEELKDFRSSDFMTDLMNVTGETREGIIKRLDISDRTFDGIINGFVDIRPYLATRISKEFPEFNSMEKYKKIRKLSSSEKLVNKSKFITSQLKEVSEPIEVVIKPEEKNKVKKEYNVSKTCEIIKDLIKFTKSSGIPELSKIIEVPHQTIRNYVNKVYDISDPIVARINKSVPEFDIIGRMKYFSPLTENERKIYSSNKKRVKKMKKNAPNVIPLEQYDSLAKFKGLVINSLKSYPDLTVTEISKHSGVSIDELMLIISDSVFILKSTACIKSDMEDAYSRYNDYLLTRDKVKETPEHFIKDTELNEIMSLVFSDIVERISDLRFDDVSIKDEFIKIIRNLSYEALRINTTDTLKTILRMQSDISVITADEYNSLSIIKLLNLLYMNYGFMRDQSFVLIKCTKILLDKYSYDIGVIK